MIDSSIKLEKLCVDTSRNAWSVESHPHHLHNLLTLADGQRNSRNIISIILRLQQEDYSDEDEEYRDGIERGLYWSPSCDVAPIEHGLPEWAYDETGWEEMEAARRELQEQLDRDVDEVRVDVNFYGDDTDPPDVEPLPQFLREGMHGTINFDQAVAGGGRSSHGADHAEEEEKGGGDHDEDHTDMVDDEDGTGDKIMRFLLTRESGGSSGSSEQGSATRRGQGGEEASMGETEEAETRMGGGKKGRGKQNAATGTGRADHGEEIDETAFAELRRELLAPDPNDAELMGLLEEDPQLLYATADEFFAEPGFEDMMNPVWVPRPDEYGNLIPRKDVVCSVVDEEDRGVPGAVVVDEEDRGVPVGSESVRVDMGGDGGGGPTPSSSSSSPRDDGTPSEPPGPPPPIPDYVLRTPRSDVDGGAQQQSSSHSAPRRPRDYLSEQVDAILHGQPGVNPLLDEELLREAEARSPYHGQQEDEERSSPLKRNPDPRPAVPPRREDCDENELGNEENVPENPTEQQILAALGKNSRRRQKPGAGVWRRFRADFLMDGKILSRK